MPLSLFRADGPPPDVPVGPPLMADVLSKSRTESL